jgi:hypothetical protein
LGCEANLTSVSGFINSNSAIKSATVITFIF